MTKFEILVKLTYKLMVNRFLILNEARECVSVNMICFLILCLYLHIFSGRKS